MSVDIFENDFFNNELSEVNHSIWQKSIGNKPFYLSSLSLVDGKKLSWYGSEI